MVVGKAMMCMHGNALEKDIYIGQAEIKCLGQPIGFFQ
jgi:hypothetical protein